MSHIPVFCKTNKISAGDIFTTRKKIALKKQFIYNYPANTTSRE